MFRLTYLLLMCVAALPLQAREAPGSGVVLLHGLARTAASMEPMAETLAASGYGVCNIDYPSREYPVEVLAKAHVLPAVRTCQKRHGQPLHFVTHSLGGIIVRYLHEVGELEKIGRVVMLGPPNAGSEVVDTIGDWALFKVINGPAGRQLGTGPQSLPYRLGPAEFELGVIAGSFSINPLLSLMIPGDDDGKVSIDNARVQGMQDFRVLPVSHPLMMRDDRVIRETRHFLRHGRFLDQTQ